MLQFLVIKRKVNLDFKVLICIAVGVLFYSIILGVRCGKYRSTNIRHAILLKCKQITLNDPLLLMELFTKDVLASFF